MPRSIKRLLANKLRHAIDILTTLSNKICIWWILIIILQTKSNEKNPLSQHIRTCQSHAIILKWRLWVQMPTYPCYNDRVLWLITNERLTPWDQLIIVEQLVACDAKCSKTKDVILGAYGCGQINTTTTKDWAQPA